MKIFGRAWAREKQAYAEQCAEILKALEEKAAKAVELVAMELMVLEAIARHEIFYRRRFQEGMKLPLAIFRTALGMALSGMVIFLATPFTGGSLLAQTVTTSGAIIAASVGEVLRRRNTVERAVQRVEDETEGYAAKINALHGRRLEIGNAAGLTIKFREARAAPDFSRGANGPPPPNNGNLPGPDPRPGGTYSNN